MISIITGVGLSFLSFMLAIAQFGLSGEPPLIAELLFSVAHWPSVITKTFPYDISNGEIAYNGSGYFRLMTIGVNAIGWGILGFLVGLIISICRSRRR